MAWRWSGDKSLSKPMIIQFNNAYIQLLGGDEFNAFWPSDALELDQH